MKDSFFLLMMLASCLVMMGCQEEEKEMITEPIKEEVYATSSDLSGVWEGGEENLYYIAINSDGRYSFCFNNHLMGSGHFTLDKTKLILKNGYTYIYDTLNFKLNGNYLSISGYITKFNRIDKEYISTILRKSNEPYPPSLVGVTWKPSYLEGLNMYYSTFETRVMYLTEYIATYTHRGKLRNTGEWKTLIDETWYYTFREPYTYTQETDGDGEVEIRENLF